MNSLEIRVTILSKAFRCLLGLYLNNVDFDNFHVNKWI